MKNYLLALTLILAIFVPEFSHADGIPGAAAPRSIRRYRPAAPAAAEPLPPPPSCVSRSPSPKIQLVSFDPHQKASKIVGSLQECVSTMYDVLNLFSGPNTIGLKYPDEKEQWGYIWLWSYKLQNPIGDSIVLMEESGKRIQKGKDPVELYITFNEHDVVESIEMDLIKKKGNKLVLFP